jgi:hypothetical protein
MSLLKQLQSKWSEGAATVATIATVDLLQKPSVAKVASVASSSDEGNAQLKPLTGFDPSRDGDPLLEILLDLGNEICDLWKDSEAARAEMRADILSYPPHQREALMATLEDSLRSEKPRFKTRQEEARFTQRMNLFFGRVDAKELAQRLTIRDREQDDRRLCLECRHFKPHRLECNNFEWAGFTQPKLGANWVSQLQRCLGFEEVEI